MSDQQHLSSCHMFDHTDQMEDLIQGLTDVITLGFDLLFIPGFANLVTIHLIRQIHGEQRENKKK